MDTDLESLAMTLAAVMQGRTVATAESLTGGQIGAVITAIPGSSRFYRGGVITYATDTKMDVLKVSPEVIHEFGVISAQTAAQMAVNVTSLMHSECGLAVTGVAGPGTQEGKAAGTIFVACHRVESEFGPAETQVEELVLNPLGLTPIERRAEIRNETVAAALELLLNML